MYYNPNIHHRRSIRLREYDYSQAGFYFVTICVQKHECLFGEIANGEMILNNVGKTVQTIWNELPQHFQNAELDAFVVMPNHIHGIITKTSFVTITIIYELPITLKITRLIGKQTNFTIKITTKFIQK